MKILLQNMHSGVMSCNLHKCGMCIQTKMAALWIFGCFYISIVVFS